MTRRVLILTYSAAAYALFLLTFVYAVGFIGGFFTPTQLDGAPAGNTFLAVALDCALLGLFALQHSGMARPRFKRWLTRHIPETAERSTYVLLSSAALLLLFALWQPTGGVIWEASGASRVAAYAAFALGWVVVLVTTFLISHFDLFGLRQAWTQFRGAPGAPLPFVTPWPYRLVRHPLYVGWLLVFWAAPTMTASHLLFAVGTTIYILAAIQWEERDLVAAHPEYAAYRSRVPMLLPRLWGRKAT